MQSGRRIDQRALRLGALLLGASSAACGSFARVPEQTYLGASYNWTYRDHFPHSDRLFNAFDYGHATLYEHLLRDEGRPVEAAHDIDGREFTYITTQLLVHPPDLPLEEHAIGPTYTTLVPELAAVFDWTHMLHRQLYDVLADARLDSAGRDARVAQLLRYYKSRHDLALSSHAKSMELMEGAFYSFVFRQQEPKFNGLLWSYHWYQMAVYDALLAANDATGQHQNVDAVTARFWQLIADAPSHMPTTMPLTAAVAPRFASRYPEAAIIFDNLHSLHDVVADILASPKVASREKRPEILRALAAFRDSTTEVVSLNDWRSMALEMGVDRMGGVAPTPAAKPR
ncbi:MAG TPA: hypothetical protein VGH98_01915 [Gemmatimonadaceae bacterium]|jgi:hypothetical protein